MDFKIYEYNLDNKLLDISDTKAGPQGNKCFKYFKDILDLGLNQLGWEIDSDGNRLGLFFEDLQAKKYFYENLKLDEFVNLKDIVAIGFFKDWKGKSETMIVSRLFSNDIGYESTGVNRISFLLSSPTDINYELTLEPDVSKYISKEGIEKIRIENGLIYSRLSHIKVDSSGKLLKVYFIEFYK